MNWSDAMSSLTVRNLDEAVKSGLRMRAASHGWSMEQEVRLILQQAVADKPVDKKSLAERIQSRFSGLDWSQETIPQRQLARTPPDFNTP
jgi:plasmid stability protein